MLTIGLCGSVCKLIAYANRAALSISIVKRRPRRTASVALNIHARPTNNVCVNGVMTRKSERPQRSTIQIGKLTRWDGPVYEPNTNHAAHHPPCIDCAGESDDKRCANVNRNSMNVNADVKSGSMKRPRSLRDQWTAVVWPTCIRNDCKR